ncbi:MAG: hypothetical protein ABIU05_12735 [Nitrospirales bacterium]
MTDLEPSEMLLPIFVGIIVLVVFSYLVSLIALIPPIKKEAQQDKAIQRILVVALGFSVCILVFLAVTRLETETSFESPPHGVVSGIWDDFEHMQSGAVFIEEKTEEELAWNDIDLQYISRERFLRYTRPPFLRDYCFTAHMVACRWTDIDLANFENTQEWLDFLIRLMIGIASGAVTGFMTSIHTESKEAPQPVEAG